MATDIAELQAGPELDALVAEKVMRWTNVPDVDDGMWWYGPNDEPYERFHLEPYSTKIAVAWKVVEQMKSRHFFLVLWEDSGGFAARFYNHEQDMEEMNTDTAPLAICKAALAAVSQSR